MSCGLPNRRTTRTFAARAAQRRSIRKIWARGGSECGNCGTVWSVPLTLSTNWDFPNPACLCATCRGEKNATEGKPEWFNELKWTIAGRKIEVRPSDVEVLTAFISGRRFLEYDDYKEPVKRYLLRLKELLAGYSDKKENRK